MIYTVAIGETLVRHSSISRVEVLDETLDYASIVLHRETSLDTKAMKEVVTITVNDNSEIRSYYFLIDSDIATPVDKDGLTYTRHELSLVELTQRLSDYTVGHRQFTNNDDSLYDVLSNLQSSIFLRNLAVADPTRSINLDLTHSSLDELKNIPSRDFRFNNHTYREAVDTIFNENGGIPRIIFENGTYFLTLEKFNERKVLRTILASSENNYKQTHNMNKYATVSESYVDNQVFDKSLGGASVSEPSSQSFMPVTTESAVFDSNSAIWKTRYPIRQLVKAEMFFTNVDATTLTFDMTPRLVHEDVYKGLDIGDITTENLGNTTDGNLVLPITPAPVGGVINQKIGTLFYKDNIVQNLYTVFDTIVWGEENMKYIINSIYFEEFGNGVGTSAKLKFDSDNYDFETLRMRITYIPLFDSALQVERYNTDNINRYTMMQSNQSASEVSTEKALKTMSTELNALGNKEIMTTNRLTLLANEFNVGDYTSDDYILTKKEVTYYRDHFDVRYEWDKDFQKRNEDIAIRSELRLTAIPKKISDRKLTYKEYAYVGFTGLTSETTLLGFTGKEIFTNIFEKSATYNTSIQNAFVTNEDVLTTATPLLLPVISSGGDNVLNFNFGFQSPNVAGNQLDTTTQSIPTLVPIEYVDENGELENINWELVDTVDVTDEKTLPLTPRTDRDNTLVGSIFNKYVVKKDSADTIDLAYQLHMIPNKNIVIGDYFASRNNLIETKTAFDNLSVYASEEFYTPNETKRVKGIKQSALSVTRLSNELIQISGTVNNASWAIATDTGELILAVNQFTETQTNVNINYFDSRFDIDYDFLGEAIISTPPATPSGLVALALNDDQIDLTWVDESTDETYFLIEISEDDLAYETLDTVNFDVTTYIASDLEPNTRYYFRVSSYNSGGTNGSYTSADAITDPAPSVPATPTNYIVTAGGTTVLNASWTAVVGATSYTIEIKRTVDSTYTTFAVPSAFQTYQFSGLSAGTSYDTRLKANNSEGSSPYATYTVSTNNNPVATTAKPSIGSVNPTATSVTFDVTNNDGSTATVYVDYNDSTPDRDSASVISGGTTGFTFTGLSPNTSYTLYAKAQASGENLSSADTQGFTTDSAPTVPNAPSNFTGVEGFQELDYSWTDNADNEDNFVLELHTNSNFSALFRTENPVANSTGVLLTEETSGTYWARLKAVNGTGSSAWVACQDNPLGIA